MTGKMRYYTQEEYDKELEHRRINRKMNRLDKLSGRVAIGFVVFWLVYIAAWVLTFVYVF